MIDRLNLSVYQVIAVAVLTKIAFITYSMGYKDITTILLFLGIFISCKDLFNLSKIYIMSIGAFLYIMLIVASYNIVGSSISYVVFGLVSILLVTVLIELDNKMIKFVRVAYAQ